MTINQTSFSQFILDQGLITREQLEKALTLQNKDRLLGSLATELGIIVEEDVLKIKEFQGLNDMKFGEAAISLGYITSSQLKYLLDVRLRKKVRIGDILVREGFIKKEAMYNALMRFEKNRLRLKNILVCDSSALVTTLLKGVLDKYGYQVAITQSPSEALEIALEKKQDLLIISQIFENVSGLDVCAELLSKPMTAGLHTIFMAQSIDKALMEKAFEAGVHHILKKPIQEYELLNIIYDIEQKELEKKSEKILVVEDSKLIRNALVRELKQHGYSVIQAPDGLMAIEIAKKECPDLITLDVIMPGIDGYETCKKLRNDPATHHIPVIMVTSCDTQEERAKGFDAGAVEYFVKPFAPNQLANYIKVLFETRKTRRKEKAVIIEDTLTTLHIIKHILEKQGIEVFAAENGKEGLQKIRELTPDIILADIYMPVMDGFKVCHEIKTSPDTRHIPFIFLTSSGKKEDILKGLALGANDYIVKPFDEDELLARVNNLLDNKMLYEKLKTVNEELAGKNNDLKKLYKEKENFYSILTHDLRSPLTSILGFSDYLLKDKRDSIAEETLTPLKIIKSSAERQLSIIEDALEIFQFEIGKKMTMQEADLAGVIHDVLLPMLQGMDEKKIRLTINGKPYSPTGHPALPCVFNRFKISRVIENLVNNALKYADSKIDLTYGVKKNCVEVKVIDDGKGIPKKNLEKIFDDFFQLPGSKPGTGLGLSSAKRIVEAHKGKIWADPAPKKCAFGFTLPR